MRGARRRRRPGDAADAPAGPRAGAPHLDDRVKPIAEWLEALAEIGGIHKPVVHLEVDVCMVVGAPRRGVAVVPDALEVGGQVSGAGATDHQVARELEQERFKPRILRAFARRAAGEAVVIEIRGFEFFIAPVSQKPLVGGKLEEGFRGFAEIKRKAVEERLVVPLVRGEKIGVGSRSRFGQPLGDDNVRMLPSPLPAALVHIIRASREEDGQGVGIFEKNPLCFSNFR